MKNEKLLGTGCGVITGICWGLSGVFSQYLFANTTMHSGWFVAVRMFAAGIFMTVYTMILQKDEVLQLLRNKRDLLLCAATGIVGIMLFQFFCYGAVQRSNAATAIVLQYLCPVIVMILTCIKKHVYPKKHEIMALILAIGGVFLIATHGNVNGLVITKEALLWGIGCAMFMSLATMLPEGLFQKYSSQTITSIALLHGGIFAAIIMQPWRNPPIMDKKSLSVLMLAIICGSVVAYLVYGFAIRHVGPTRASLYACAEIPTATALSVIFLDYRFAFLDIVGFAMIGSTIFILSDLKNKG